MTLTMTKPKSKWAPRNGEWGPIKPGFWDIWHANKKSLQDNGYSIRKDDNGQWQVRWVPGIKKGWPEITKPEPVTVPAGLKASICMKCGNVRLIKFDEPHKDCGICGEKIAPAAVATEGAMVLTRAKVRA